MEIRATLMQRTIADVTIEYDSPKGRVRKTVPMRGSRGLYAKLLKSGKNPKVVAASRE